MNTLAEKVYRDEVAARFIEAMRSIIHKRLHGVKNVSQFAAMIGEHQQNISKMEKSSRYPTIDQICRLCETFEISPVWILLNQGKMMQKAVEDAPFDKILERLTSIETEMVVIKKKIK